MKIERHEYPHSGAVSFCDDSTGRFFNVDVDEARISLCGPSSQHRGMTLEETAVVSALLRRATREAKKQS